MTALPVRYTVQPADVRAHLFAVRCVVGAPDPRGQVFRLPSWIRGSYLVRDFAKHVIGLSARRGKRKVAIERLDKRSFRCAAGSGELTIDYQVHAFDPSVRKAWLDTRRGFYNGSSLFYCPAGFEAGAFEVEIVKPADPACRKWRLATTLPAARVRSDGFGVYRAGDYEELIDHPVEMGEFDRIEFDVDGIPHALVLAGRHEVDRERVARDLAAVCHVERELFGQQPQLDQYLFLTNVLGAGYGGLEHRSSTALVCSRADLPAPGAERMSREYRGFLGLCAHEYFHLWNVKRIAPQAFAQSNLAAEAYTRDLWHYEGVTSYYDDLSLLRAKVIDAPSYLDLIAEAATRLQRTPGRRLHTLADASFEAWIKYYQPDENSANATVNYYVKGALAALCLDLTLRLQSKTTLDAVMKTLWQRYGAVGVGVPEGGLEQVVMELSRLDLEPLLDRLLRSTDELPLAGLLVEFGVAATLRPQLGDADNGGRVIGEAPQSWTGLRFKPGELRVAQVQSGSPGERAGLAAEDLIVALDGLRVAPAQWGARLGRTAPGRAQRVHFFRGDELLDASLTAQPPPLDTWTLALAAAKGAALARRKRWLGA
jgi:predicted metalloprotease with PDZ domain